MKKKDALSWEDRWAETKAWYEDRVAGVMVPALERWIAEFSRSAATMRERLSRKRTTQ